MAVILRRSKADYSGNYFAKNKTNIKETQKGIFEQKTKDKNQQN